MTKLKKTEASGVLAFAPHILLMSLAVFLLAAIGVGEFLNGYEKIWWWDDMLHTVAGVIMGLLGFLMVYFFNAKYAMNINPVFVAVFSIGFAMIMAVTWEIFEFSMDVFFGTQMQRWNLPGDTTLIGKPYQGGGLRDTMSDLIVCAIGSFIAAVGSYYAFKHKKRASLTVMRRTVGRLRGE